MKMYSRFALYHDRTVTIANKPTYAVDELDSQANEMEASIQLRLTEVA